MSDDWRAMSAAGLGRAIGAGEIDPRDDPGAFLAKVKRRFIDGEE